MEELSSELFSRYLVSVLELGEYSFGVNNVWAIKRFVEPEVWVEIVATRLEVELVQFSLDLLDPATSDEDTLSDTISRTNDCCKKYGVKIQSCFTGLLSYATNLMLHPSASMRENGFQCYSKACRIAGEFGAETFGGHMGAFTQKDYDDNKRKETLLSELIEHVASLSRVGKEAGLKTILWEPMPVSREPPSTIPEAKAILTRVGKDAEIPVQLCIDVGHACNMKSNDPRDRDPYSWLSELGASSPCVHLQQTDGKGDRHWPFTKEYNRIGIIDGKKVVEALDRSGTRRTYLYLEAIGAFDQDENVAVADIVESVGYWKNYV